MPYVGIRPEHRAKITASLRHSRFDAIANPLWHAIANNRTQEAAWLMDQLRALVDADRLKRRENLS